MKLYELLIDENDLLLSGVTRSINSGKPCHTVRFIALGDQKPVLLAEVRQG